MVLLVLSVVANNIINVYSMGMSISVIATFLAAVPRLVWPCVITAIYIPLAIVGANNFAGSLGDFLGVLGYWLAIYVTIVLEEHFIFRKANYDNYNAAETWNRSDLLPWGAAALFAGCVGVAGAVVGMAQVWYIGPSEQSESLLLEDDVDKIQLVSLSVGQRIPSAGISVTSWLPSSLGSSSLRFDS